MPYEDFLLTANLPAISAISREQADAKRRLSFYLSYSVEELAVSLHPIFLSVIFSCRQDFNPSCMESPFVESDASYTYRANRYAVSGSFRKGMCQLIDVNKLHADSFDIWEIFKSGI